MDNSNVNHSDAPVILGVDSSAGPDITAIALVERSTNRVLFVDGIHSGRSLMTFAMLRKMRRLIEKRDRRAHQHYWFRFFWRDPYPFDGRLFRASIRGRRSRAKHVRR